VKKFGRVVLIILCLFLVGLIPLQFLAGIHDQELAERPPLTLEDLDRLAPALMPSAPKEDGPSKPEEDAASAETPLPKRLERALTHEERTEYWLSAMGRNNKMGKFAYKALGILDAPLRYAGFRPGTSYERAKAALWAGDFDGARRQFAEYIYAAEGSNINREVFIDLAFLEDDPELAARYMELSCADENDLRGGYEAMAVYLAEKTGSKKLEAHYRAKLEAIEQRRKETGWQP